MTAKTLPELTSYIESRIRLLGRDNHISEWSSCIDLYCDEIKEKRVIVHRVLAGEERPTRVMLYSLIGHMGITSVYETSDAIQCDKCKHTSKEYYYVIETIDRS